MKRHIFCFAVSVLVSLLSFGQPVFTPGPYKAGTLVKDTAGRIWQAKRDMAKATTISKTYWLEVSLVPALTLEILDKRMQFLEKLIIGPMNKMYTTPDSSVWTDGTIIGNGTRESPYRVNPNVIIKNWKTP